MNPRTKDARNRTAGWAARAAITDTRKASEQLGITPRQVRRYRNGHQSNPIRHFEQFLAAVDDPWRVSAHIESYVKWLTIHKETTARLVERWHELTDAEHDQEAAENRAIACGRDAEAEIRADEREAALQTERSAVRTVLMARGVNPRDYRRER